MSTSSLPENYSKILDDIGNLTLTPSSGVDTITLTGSTPSIGTITFDTTSGMYTTYGAGGTTYTIGSGISSGNVTIDTINTSSFNWTLPEEWKDDFPKWARVQDMCKQYPALEIALRNFQTVYELVKDDYDNPTPKK